MESEFGRVINALPGLVWTAGPNGYADFLNQRWLEYTGLEIEDALVSGWQNVIHPDDRPSLLASWREHLARGEGGELEARIRRHDGVYHWFDFRFYPITDSTGRIVKWCGLNTDIENLKRAEESARLHEARFRAIIEGLPAIVTLMTPEGAFEHGNQHMVDYLGAPLQELKSRPTTQSFHPDDRPEVDRRWKHSIRTGEPYDFEARLKGGDENYRWFHTRGFPLRDPDGGVALWYLLQEDVDERRKAAEALRASERNLQLIIDTTPALIWSADPMGKTDSVNRHFLDYVGLSWQELQDAGWETAIHPADRDALTEVWRSLQASGSAGQTEARFRRHDGEYRWFLFHVNPLRDESGKIVKWYGVNTDIEDRKRAEEALAASERNLRQTINAIPALVFCNRADGPNEYLNQRWHDYTGLSAEQVRGDGWQAPIHPDDLPNLMEKWLGMLASGQSGEVEGRLRRFDGVYRWFQFRTDALRDDAGKIIKWYGTTTDIDDLKRTEQELQRSEAFLAHGEAVSETGSFLWRFETTGEIRWSDQLHRIFGLEKGAPITLERIAARVHPEDLWMLDDMVARAREGRGLRYDHRLLMPDGTVRYLHFVARATHDDAGRLEYIGTVQNVTERRLAEEALSKVRSELAHVARVTSLNALTASIAHEVNQPLSGIITNASTCLRMLAADPPNVDGARETARRTIRDGNRASEVITRLRALFRKTDPAIEPIDLNEAAREVVALSLSELQRSRVVLRQEFAEDLPRVSGDRVQLQQVILNLILNASDAMSEINDRPRLLVIRTKADEEDRVRLQVQDVGVGLDQQNIARLFDAFYTTKPSGMGIGLSVSRSIIESHHGSLWAIANDGPGATFSFSIPCSQEGVDALGAPQLTATTSPTEVRSQP